MTKATYYNDEKCHYLHVKDHATGSPQVCAAISGILYALAGWLRNAEGWGKAEVFTCSMESGDVILDATGGAEVEAAFDLAVIGLLQIAEGYPEYLRVEEGEGKCPLGGFPLPSPPSAVPPPPMGEA